MDYLWTTGGLLYNGPALLVLAWVVVRRPEAGVPLVAIAYLRVVAGALAFSGHAAVAMAAVVALPRWERLMGAALGLFTAWYYLGAWAAPAPFSAGLVVGTGIGMFSLGVRLAWWYATLSSPAEPS